MASALDVCDPARANPRPYASSSEAEIYIRQMTSRLQRSDRVAALLAQLDEPAIEALLAGATDSRQGIGSRSGTVEVAGEQVFVKVMPLTDDERAARGSTANIFGAPPWCQWGVGAVGFGVWRDLSAHETVSTAVRAGRTGAFPLLHAAVTVPRTPQAVDDAARSGWAAEVHRWHGAAGVAARLEALHRASSSLVFFLEHMPLTVDEWLRAELARGEESGAAALALLSERLPEAITAMHDLGILHFDLHLRNVLTDGTEVYVSDFGLATSPAFDLDNAERDFLAATGDYDAAYCLSEVVKALATHHLGVIDWSTRNEWIRAVSTGDASPPRNDVGSFIRRFAAPAVVMLDFFVAVYGGDRRTPFPTEALARACDDANWQVGDPWS